MSKYESIRKSVDYLVAHPSAIPQRYRTVSTPTVAIATRWLTEGANAHWEFIPLEGVNPFLTMLLIEEIRSKSHPDLATRAAVVAFIIEEAFTSWKTPDRPRLEES